MRAKRHVHRTLMSVCRVSRVAGRWLRSDTKVSSTPSSDRSEVARLVSCEKEVSMAPATVTERRTEQTTDKTAIRPFRFEAADAELDEMRRRITATRFPEKETVADFSQGVQLAFMQALARY